MQISFFTTEVFVSFVEPIDLDPSFDVAFFQGILLATFLFNIGVAHVCVPAYT